MNNNLRVKLFADKILIKSRRFMALAFVQLLKKKSFKFKVAAAGSAFQRSPGGYMLSRTKEAGKGYER